MSERILIYDTFRAIIAISRQKETRSRDYVLLLSNDFFKWFFIVHNTIDSTALSVWSTD